MNFKEKLKSECCIGTFLKLPRPEIVEILSLVGFDFIICDMEHAQISEIEAREIIKTGVATNIPIIIRIPDPTQGVINRLLEAGATGIQIPRLKNSNEINKLNNIIQFPPKGKRSFGNSNPNAKYGEISIHDYIKSENKRVITVGQFETKEIEEPLTSMFEELDVAFIGPTDLCIDFEVPGNIEDKAVQNHIIHIEEISKKTNTTLGIFAKNVDQAKEYIEKGYKYIAISGDASIIYNGAKSVINNLKM